MPETDGLALLALASLPSSAGSNTGLTAREGQQLCSQPVLTWALQFLLFGLPFHEEESPDTSPSIDLARPP